MGSQDKEEHPEVVKPIEVEESPEVDEREETPWFLSLMDSQHRITVDKNIRTLYNYNHKDLLWVKVRKSRL